MYTAKSSVAETNSFEAEIFTENLRRYKSPDADKFRQK
jgi:hypothetical protein